MQAWVGDVDVGTGVIAKSKHPRSTLRADAGSSHRRHEYCSSSWWGFGGRLSVGAELSHQHRCGMLGLFLSRSGAHHLSSLSTLEGFQWVSVTFTLYRNSGVLGHSELE